MRTTLNLDDHLIREAGRLTGLRAKAEVIHEGLRALIARESARWLAALGGNMPAAKALPRIAPVTHGEAMALVAERRLGERGLGWVDVRLLAAALVAGARLWTLDRRLRKVAHELGLARAPAQGSAAQTTASSWS